MSTRPSTLTFIGTATMVLDLGPFTVLTDPNFLHRGQFAYLGWGLATRRRTEPARTIDQLPPLDAVVLSHMHGDHWDRVARKGLPKDLPVFTTPAAARALHRQGFEAGLGLATWESTTLERDGYRLTVTATPGEHATGLVRRLLPPVMGSMLDLAAPDGTVSRLYITGDTLFVDALHAIPERFPDIDTAVLHLGGTTLPGGRVVTMDADQGVRLVQLVRPQHAVPVHNDDYGVFKSPLDRFLRAVEAAGLTDTVRVAPPGEPIPLFGD